MSASQMPTTGQSTRGGRRVPRTAGTAPLVLDRYRLHRRLGSGAFGTVWLAHDERLDREVAVKIVARERVIGGRFEREARAAARLAHPGIVTLYEAAVDDDGAYLVSELVRGATFDQLQSAGRLSDRDIVGIGIALCDALAHAHAHGVVHRDVKPSNILVPERPLTPAQVAKLTDFGVARVVGGDSLTITGDVIGTLAYMSPEQAEGREATFSADLYSLALVIYEALTGVNPVRRGTAAQRARRLGAHLPPLRRQRRDLPRELGQAIDMALRPRPRERGRLDELREALALVHQRVEDRPGLIGAPWPGQAVRDATGLSPAETGAFAPAAAAAASSSSSSSSSSSFTPLPSASRAAGVASDAEAEADPQIGASLPQLRWPERGLAAAGAATAAAWISAHALTPGPVAPAASGLIAGALVLALPRIGWLALSVVVFAIAVFQHHPGIALMLMIAALVPLVLLPRSGWCWPLSVVAPALGLIGLAGAWPALAARARTTWQRAGLGATGWLWLALAGPIAGRVLYLPTVPGTVGRDAFAGSLSQTAHHLLVPLASSGVLLAAPVWALGAATLPLLVRGRSLISDLLRAIVWAAALLAATGLALATGGSHAVTAPPSAILGAFVSVAAALAPSAVKAWRATPDANGLRPRVP
jgi:eukaryotic-like serine/threonine-protein kinase